MDIIEVVNIINDTYEEVYEKYGNGFVHPKAEINFLSYSYEYHKLLKRFFPEAVLVIQNDKRHCATLIDGKIYDVTGLREDTGCFHIATGVDIEYIYKYYAFFSSSLKENLNKAVSKNVLSRKDNYSKKLCKKPTIIV